MLFHLVIKLLVSRFSRPRWVRWYYKRIYPLFYIARFTVVDSSEKALVLEHELFRHLEMEVFIPERHFPEAVDFIRDVVSVFAGTVETISDDAAHNKRALHVCGMSDKVRETLKALDADKSKSYVVEVSPLGLVEMTRQNITDGVREILTAPCPTCPPSRA